MKKIVACLEMLVVFSLLLEACGPVATEAPVTEEPTEVTSEAPTEKSLVLTLTVLRGIVKVNSQPVIEEVEVSEGDIITTGPNGFAQLIFFADEDIHTEVKSNTQVQVETLLSGEIRLFLVEGSMRNTMEPGQGVRFVVVAEAGEVESTGTIWISEVKPSGDLLVAVLEGQVVARSPGGYETEVSERQRLEIPLDRPPGLPKSTVFIGFDTSYENRDKPDTTLTGHYSLLASELTSAGYIIEEIVDSEDNGFYDALIGSYDVLIVLDPEHDLALERIQTIHGWVDQGHGLFVVGEQRSAFAQSSINELLVPYGVEFTEESLTGETVAESFDSHDVTQGVNKLLLHGAGTLKGGLELGYADSGHLVLSAYENVGRVLVLADSDSLTNRNWGAYDEAVFIVNAIKWLAEAK